jgi:anaerobic ribonucleoside-triphosphate reductase
VTGYLRPVSNFNKGKKEEYRNRKIYILDKELEAKVS